MGSFFFFAFFTHPIMKERHYKGGEKHDEIRFIIKD